MTKDTRCVLNEPLSKGRQLVSASAFAYLFSTIVQKSESKTSNYDDFCERLSSLGVHVGLRMLELTAYREGGSNFKREDKSLIAILTYITKVLWKVWFGKVADQLLKKDDGSFLIVESEPITNTFVSPRKGSSVNVAVFIGGIIQGVLESSGNTVNVQSLFGGKDNLQTVFVIKPL